MRERLAWAIVLPLAAAGCELGHASTNALMGSPTGPDGELFEGGPLGPELVPLVLAVGVAVLLLGLVDRIANGHSTASRRSARSFAWLPPLAFSLQEHIEHIAHGGGAWYATILEPTFAPGLAAQLPFALVSYACARALVRLAGGVARLIARSRPLASRRLPRVCALRPRSCARPSPPRLGATSERGPPGAALAAG